MAGCGEKVRLTHWQEAFGSLSNVRSKAPAIYVKQYLMIVDSENSGVYKINWTYFPEVL